ncbi:hypothetical protein GGI03_002636 [Coemansia sp. RSA 2337]|nr:hypothetical protein GGI03_002636 [Coemansia sp. RSA 2337]
MDQTFESFINQSLVDSLATDTADSGDIGVENELFMQLIMSAAPPSSDAGTIDPSELSLGVTGDEGAFMAAGDADQNALLTAALLSTLEAMPPAAFTAIGLGGDNAMLVDSPPPIATIAPTETITPTETVAPTAIVAPAARPKAAPAAKRKPTGQAPGTATAGKRAAGVSGGPAAKKPATGAVPSAAADPASPAASRPASPGVDDEDIDPKSLPPMQRRQLRNKISARKFRVRRKEQLTSLLSDSLTHQEEIDGLRTELAAVRKDNAIMREEIKRLRLRLGATVVPPASSSATAVAAASVRVGQATPVPTRPVPQQQQQPKKPQQQPPVPSRPIPQRQQQPLPVPVPIARPIPQQQVQPPSVIQPKVPHQPQLPAAGTKAVPTVAPTAPAARFNPHKDVGQAGPKKDGNWAAKDGRSGFIAVNTATVPAEHAERLESLVAETQSRRALEALLNVGGGTQHPSPVASPLYPAPHVLAMFEMVAEYILSQIVLEASFTMAYASSHSVKVSC